MQPKLGKPFDGGGTPFAAAFCLRLADTLHRALVADGSLELREDAKHLQEASSGRCAGVDRLLGGSKGDLLLFKFVYDRGELRERVGKAVNAGHNNHVTGSCKVDQGQKCHPTLGGRAAPRFLTGNLILSIPQGFDLRPSFAPTNSLSHCHR